MKKIIFAFLLFSGVARAVPTTFSVQGVLRDGSGALQSATVSVTASLWDAQSAGNKLAGDYGPTDVMATNGLFTLPIDDATLATKLAGASQVWLEVGVGSDVFPRQLVTSQLFAQMCGVAESLPYVSTSEGFVHVTNPSTVANSYAMAVTTSDPNVKALGVESGGVEGMAVYGSGEVRVRGNLVVGNDTHGAMVGSVGNPQSGLQLANPGNGLDAKIAELIQYGTGVFGRFVSDDYLHANNWLEVIRVSGYTVDHVSFPSGNVGIGTSSPAYKLDVNGSARIAGIQIFIKDGNDGTATCSDFCRGSGWAGGVGECIGGKNVNTGQYIGCGYTSGVLTHFQCMSAGIP